MHTGWVPSLFLEVSQPLEAQKDKGREELAHVDRLRKVDFVYLGRTPDIFKAAAPTKRKHPNARNTVRDYD